MEDHARWNPLELSMNGKRFAVLGGAGKMGGALIDGLLASGKVAADDIIATARHAASLEKMADRKIRTGLDNLAAVQGADVVVLAVHPDETAEVLRHVSPALGPDKLVISIVTGVRTSGLEAMIGAPVPVMRANPNIAVTVQQSATVICRGKYATDAHATLTKQLFATVGLVEELDERHMNASTGLGGCGPAFIFKIIEAMAEGGVKMGLPRDVARKLAAQVLRGASEMVLITGKHPAALKDEVTTPGGCTIDGIAKLEERGLAIALIDAVETSSRKAGMLWPE
jgi:pyrroline-5-carboxylate reductase